MLVKCTEGFTTGEICVRIAILNSVSYIAQCNYSYVRQNVMDHFVKIVHSDMKNIFSFI